MVKNNPWKLLTWILLCFFISLSIFDLAVTINIPTFNDAEMFNFFGYNMLKGAIPYKDFFDNNFPGVYILHAIITKLFGTADIGIKIFDTLFILLISAGILLFFGKELLIEGLFCAAIITVIHSLMGTKIILERDSIGFSFVLFAASFSYKFLESKNYPYLFTAAMLCAVASAFKPTMGLFILVFFCHLVFCRKSSRKELLKIIAVITAGIFSVWLPLISWLTYLGTLGNFIKISFVITPIYASLNSNHSYSVFLTFIYLLVYFLRKPVLKILVGQTGQNNSTAVEKNTILNLLVFSCLLNIIIQNKGFLYHLYPFFISLLLLGFFILASMFKSSPVQKSKYKFMIYDILLLIILIFSPITYHPKTLEDYGSIINYRKYLQQDILSAYSKSVSHLGNMPKTWQFFDIVDADLYYMGYKIGFEPATNQSLPLCLYSESFTETYVHSVCAKFRADLAKATPAVIAIAKGKEFKKTPNTQIDKEFAEYLKKHYEVSADKNHYIIYARVVN